MWLEYVNRRGSSVQKFLVLFEYGQDEPNPIFIVHVYSPPEKQTRMVH
jgi:hypothetical protein